MNTNKAALSSNLVIMSRVVDLKSFGPTQYVRISAIQCNLQLFNFFRFSGSVSLFDISFVVFICLNEI